MREIDEMDMIGYIRLRAWNAKKDQDKRKPRRCAIDQVWPGLKP